MEMKTIENVSKSSGTAAYEISDFKMLERVLRDSINEPVTVAIACAHDYESLKAIFKAEDEGLADYLLLGIKPEIINLAERLHKEGACSQKQLDELIGRIVHCENDEEAAVKAVEAIRSGKAQVLFKGIMQTKTLLKEVVNKDRGLGTGSLMSSVVLLDVPRYHKIFAVTDPGMVMYPDLADKVDLVKNAEKLMTSFGYEAVKVAGICAIEVVNEKMPETVDAARLEEMSTAGELGRVTFQGPLSMDVAMNKEMAEHKKTFGSVAGNADVLLVPSIATGNVIVKSLMVLADAKMAGCVVGASCPIVLTSRSADFSERYYSILACALSASR